MRRGDNAPSGGAAPWFPDQPQLAESAALPLLRDTRRREFSCRLEKSVSRAELMRLLGGPPALDGAPRPVQLDLAGVKLDLKRARVRWAAGAIRATLLAAPVDSN